MTSYIKQEELKQIIVQRKDGSTWTAELDLDGKLVYVKQLSDPDRQVTQAEGQAQQPEQPQEQEQEQQQEQPAQTEEAWGDEAQPTDEQYSDEEMEKLIKGMESAGGNAPPRKPGRSYRPIGEEYKQKLKDSAFLARLRSVMLDNKYARRVRGRTRGKLDMARLYKAPTGARSLFLQKQERRGKEYNVVLCIDQSGSMAGKKIDLATETAMFLVKQFEHLNINIGIIGYSDATYVYKELNDKRVNYDELYADIHQSFGGTNDYPALRRAYHMLSKAPQGEKILLMLSDGSPGSYTDAPFYGVDGNKEHIPALKNLLPDSASIFDDNGYINYNQRDHLHHLVKANADVHSIGIGMGAGGWQIPEHFVIHNVSDLKKTVIGVLRRQIKRG